MWTQVCRTQLWLLQVELVPQNAYVEMLTSGTPERDFLEIGLWQM